MCRASAEGSGTGGAQKPGGSEREAGYRSPGLRGVKTTSLFRAVNPELFIRPVNHSSFHFIIQKSFKLSKLFSQRHH